MDNLIYLNTSEGKLQMKINIFRINKINLYLNQIVNLITLI
jgi:hypothetical protein